MRAVRVIACARPLAYVVTRLALWTSLVLASHATEPVRADEGAPVVHVSMADGGPVDPELLASLQELGARLGLALQTAADPAVWGELQLVQAADGETEIAFTSTGRPTLRRTVAPAASPALHRETVAHAALAMLEARQAEPEEVPIALPTATRERDDGRASTPTQPHRLSLRSDLSVGPAWLSAHEVAARVQGSLGLLSDRRFAPSLSLTLAGSFLPHRQSDDVDARMNLLSARLRPSVNVLSVSKLVLEVGTPVGFDVAFASLSAPRQSGELETRHEVHVQPVLGALVTGHVRLTPTLAIALSAGFDLDLKPRAWTTGDLDDVRTTLSLARVRPYLTAGVSWGATPGAR